MGMSESISLAGYEAARAGTKWWKNPHPSGSLEAYQWDNGHTRHRTNQGSMT